MTRLAGTAVVTGAASGIGLALASRFVQEGMSVVLADRDDVQLAESTAWLTSQGGDVSGLQCDVAVPDDLERLAASVFDRHGTIRLLCSNAGILGPMDERLWELPAAEWQRIVDVNLLGVVNTLYAFVPRLLAQRSPADVVTTASSTGLMATTGTFSPYTACKHAVVALTETLRVQLAAVTTEVRAHVLCPGVVQTDLLHREWSRPEQSAPSHPMRDLVAGLAEQSPVTPAGVAEQVVRAVADDQFYILTHAEEFPSIEERWAGITAAMSDLQRQRPVASTS